MLIIGGGATGIELAAQLHQVAEQFSIYGFDLNVDRDIKITLIESADRILPALPIDLAQAAEKQLNKLNIAVKTAERVTQVDAHGARTANGSFYAADICVWAAGIKAPDLLTQLDGLQTNDLNQLVTSDKLMTTLDETIYAIGDCAACPMPTDQQETVPPRAQAAHQQARYLTNALRLKLKHKEVKAYIYKDYGSLVTLGKYSTLGNLMSAIFGNLTVSGMLARAMYLSLHQMHKIVLYGWTRSLLLTLANLLRRTVDPKIKLH